MFSVELDTDEKIITTFRPPTRALYYSLIKNSPTRFIIILILFYYVFSGLYSWKMHLVLDTPSHVVALNSLHQLKYAVAKQTQPASEKLILNTPKTKTWSHNYSFQGTGADLKPYFLMILAFFLTLYLYSQIKKQRARIASVSYTVTNKRILILSTLPRQQLKSINYSKQKSSSILQTPLHRLLKLYYICLSSSPIESGSINGVSQMIYASNDIVDMLTKEQAEYFIKLFHDNPVGLLQPNQQLESFEKSPVKIQMDNSSSSNFGEKTIINSQPLYVLFLMPGYFILYGFWYALSLLVLFAGPLHRSGFFNVFYSWNTSITFLAGYVFIFIIIAYIRSLYQIKMKSQFIFTKNELILPQRPQLFTSQKSIPYHDIVNLNIIYSGFNLYQVNFTANIKKLVLGSKNEYQVSQIHLCIPGLSKKDAELIPLLINQ